MEKQQLLPLPDLYFRPDGNPVKNKLTKQEVLRGKIFEIRDLETVFSEELFINPNLHQIHTNTTSRKSKGAFCLFSIFLYRFFTAENLPVRTAERFPKIPQIHIDFFISIVYDNIANYGTPPYFWGQTHQQK